LGRLRPLWKNQCFVPARGRDRSTQGETTMSKRARKRRSRKGNAANHGRKPNA
jgi:hypothetical protein